MSERPVQNSRGDQSPNVNTDSGDVSITYNTRGWSPGRSLSAYINELLALLGSPRAFLNELAADGEKLLPRGIIFLALSALISFPLRMAPGIGSSVNWGFGLVSSIYYLVNGLALGVVALLCCRIFGGQGAARSHVGMFCFMAGGSAVFFSVLSLAAQVLVLISLPDHFGLYREFMADMLGGRNPDVPPALASGLALEASIALVTIGSLVLLVWLAVAWRSLGDLNGFSAARVSASLLLFLFLGFWVSTGMSALQQQLGMILF